MKVSDIAGGSDVKIHACINKHNVVLMTEAIFGVESGLLVKPMEYFGRYMQFLEPSQVQIRNKRDGRVYNFMSTSITPVKTRYGNFHLIRCSSALDPENSRKSERFNIEKLGVFRINGNSATMKNCIVHDLSMRGMSLIVDNASKCKIGDQIDVTFRYDNTLHNYEVSAVIVRMFAVKNKPAIGCSISNMNVDLIGLLNNKKTEKYGTPEPEVKETERPAPDLNPEISQKQQILEVEEDIAKQLIPEKNSPKRVLNANPLDPSLLEHISSDEKTDKRRRREHLMAEQAKAIENLLDLRDV
ncbi:PilZ domain-containing protein [Butyrivibrio sp. YAB3001]|uniref:PilZ domain-containing protein n=1 Tax=Butyrivibrio sp. YAB3001 TaxID=1520812 RepID=UPI0008F67104|nr:PilZ domain-containing protein [Butyrivibrio sp. YAB3001]SFB71508.1 PilZ domain-containing protein [Butyrivibrio sp. YAB3001]